MSKHTKGPWRWTRVEYGNGRGGYVQSLTGSFDALWSDAIMGPVFVAQDASSYAANCDVPNEVDARLIAAAPDLVAALEPFGEFARMMDEIEHVKTTPDDAVIHPGLTVGHFRRAREVVAKAKGEA